MKTELILTLPQLSSFLTCYCRYAFFQGFCATKDQALSTPSKRPPFNTNLSLTRYERSLAEVSGLNVLDLMRKSR